MKPFLFSIDSVETHNPKGKKPDSDWLTIILTINDPRTDPPNTGKTLSSGPFHIGSNIGDNTKLSGPWTSGLIEIDEFTFVTVAFVIMNLSSLSLADQGNKAIDFTAGLAKAAAPTFFNVTSVILAGAAAVPGTPVAAAVILGASAAVSQILVQETDKILDRVIVPFIKDIIDFLANILGDTPACDGEVLRNLLAFSPTSFESFAQSGPIDKEFTGPQENSRCGLAPNTKVTYSVISPSLRNFLKGRVVNPSGSISLRSFRADVPSVRALMQS